ncbi:hypothetical protein C5E45_28245 [Nocardia nova]|uniref:Cardiolipin synthase N-terminal domain-containing protein n=1 Tax=Nocardia nova TaxID=37330 RepID=A0A2S6AI94_9NOCA|nr:hypothetical protein [Nocardia nova]PPJ24145.1 hypothetical protein C5E41_22835 [Nocardia nova]PPJ34915.1 hypothetical protein C5E45_28245 [Nocardia nova]
MVAGSTTWNRLAEAGLSDCVRYDACPDDGLGLFVVACLVLFVLGPPAVLLAGAATLDIIDRPTGLRRGLAWTAVVWLAPLIGPFIWWSAWPRHNQPGQITEYEPE